MRKSFFLLTFSFLMVCFFVQCKKDNVESQQENQNNNTCDTTNVNYTKVAGILSVNSCTGCHGGGTSVPLNNYDNVKTNALSGRLVGAIEHLSGYTPMPNSTQKISECDRNTIKAWINQGVKN